MTKLMTELGTQFDKKYRLIKNKFEEYISELKIFNRINKNSDTLEANFFTEFRKKLNNCSGINNSLDDLNKIISELNHKCLMAAKDDEAKKTKENYRSDYKECKKAFSSLRKNIDNELKENFNEILKTLNNIKNIHDHEIKYEILATKNNIDNLLLFGELITLQNNTVGTFQIKQKKVITGIIENLFDFINNSFFEKYYITNILVLILRIKKDEKSDLIDELDTKELLSRLSKGLSDERKKLHFSLDVIADKINVNKSTLSRIERNNYYKDFPAEIAEKIAKFFNKSLGEFLHTETYVDTMTMIKVNESLNDHKYIEFYRFYLMKK